MKRQLFLLLCIMVLSVSSALAESDRPSGHNLLQDCTVFLNIVEDGSADRNDLGSAYRCASYIRGIADMNSAYAAVHADAIEPFFCAPQNVSTGQMVRVVVKYLNENPDSLHNDKFLETWRALSQAFPCK